LELPVDWKCGNYKALAILKPGQSGNMKEATLVEKKDLEMFKTLEPLGFQFPNHMVGGGGKSAILEILNSGLALLTGLTITRVFREIKERTARVNQSANSWELYDSIPCRVNSDP
jgi:hypothetical protein